MNAKNKEKNNSGDYYQTHSLYSVA